MPPVLLISISMLCAVLLVQVAAVGAAAALQRSERLLRERLPYLVALAVGVLLATALLHLLPEALATLGNRSSLWRLLGGTILVLFATERIFYAVTGTTAEQPNAQSMLLEHEMHAHGHAHGHTADCQHAASDVGDVHGRGARPMNLLLAGMLHSFVDGATVAAGFAAGPRIGMLSAFAVALHEIPHRVGDFALFLHLGCNRRTALRYAVLEGVPALVAAVGVLLLGVGSVAAVRWLLPISAGSFLYLALVNLLPELQIECRMRRVAGQLLCLLAGVLLVATVAGLG